MLVYDDLVRIDKCELIFFLLKVDEVEFICLSPLRPLKDEDVDRNLTGESLNIIVLNLFANF